MQPSQIHVALAFIIVSLAWSAQLHVASVSHSTTSHKVRLRSSRTGSSSWRSPRKRVLLSPGFFTEPDKDIAPRVPENGWSRQLTLVAPGVFKEEDSSSRTGVTTWRSRSINTTLTCKEPGCVATAQLLVFADGEELVRNCAFTLDVHPTDFDDRYSGERVEWVQLNGAAVNRDCFPMLSACNKTTQSPTFTCVRDMPISTIVNSTGVLNIRAKIPNVVDECPYEGNMLSAVATVKCLVTPTYTTTTTTLRPMYPMNLSVEAIHPTFVYRRSPLRCFHRNCTAKTIIDTTQHWLEFGQGGASLDRASKPANYSKCLLNVIFFQTDFDQDDGTEEMIDFISVAGSVRKRKIAPGKNPCRLQWETGVRPPQEELLYTAIQDLDVTESVSGAWNVTVEAKITALVDECSYEGYLLNGFAELNCTVDYGNS